MGGSHVRPGAELLEARRLKAIGMVARGASQAEVARQLGVSRTWVYDAAKHGRIPSVRIGGEDGPLRFVAEDLDAWIEQARAGWTPRSATRRRSTATAERRAGPRAGRPRSTGQQSLL